MPLAFPSSQFAQWVRTACTPTEQLSIGSGVVPDLGRYGLPLKDPDLIKLAQAQQLPSGLVVNVFVWPEKVTTAPRRTRRIWFGIVEVVTGPPPAPGRLLIGKAWASDPGTFLVTVEQELLSIAALEFP